MVNEIWLLAVLVVLLIGIITGQVALLVMAFLLLLTGAMVRLWNKVALKKVSYIRHLSQTKAFVDDRLDYTVTLTNSKLLPLIWVDIQDRFPRGLELEGVSLLPSHLMGIDYHRTVTSVAPYQRVTWRYHIRCKERGLYRIGPAMVASGDPFGFLSQEAEQPEVQELVVYPRIVPLPALGLPSARPLGEAKGWQRIFEDPSRFAGLRDFQEGDPIKRIDWKASARRQTLQAKVYEPTVSLNLLIVLNVATAEHLWEGYSSYLLEKAVTAAASLADHGSSQRFSIGLLTNGIGKEGGRWTRIMPGRSPAQLAAILEVLAKVGPFYWRPIGEILLENRASLPGGLTIALVTGLVDQGMILALKEMARLGHRVILVYVGSEELKVSPDGVAVHPVGKALDRWMDGYGPTTS